MFLRNNVSKGNNVSNIGKPNQQRELRKGGGNNYIPFGPNPPPWAEMN